MRAENQANEAGDEASAQEARDELTSITAVLGELEVQTLLNGEYDANPAVITIRSGAGGVDAADFAEMLLRMYVRWAEKHNYKVTVLDTTSTCPSQSTPRQPGPATATAKPVCT